MSSKPRGNWGPETAAFILSRRVAELLTPESARDENSPELQVHIRSILGKSYLIAR